MRSAMLLPIQVGPSGSRRRFLLPILAGFALAALAAPRGFADEPTPLSVVPTPTTEGASSEPADDPTAEPANTLQVVPREDESLPTRATTPPESSAPAVSPVEPDEPAGEATIVEDAVPAGKTSPAPAEEAIEPIPEASSSEPPTVETASFNGVTPGRTTLAQIAKQWGPPQSTRDEQGTLIHRYAVEPFKQVEVAFSGERVASIVVRLDKAFPAKLVAEQLQLTNIRPVLVSNELGDILGQSYPERGVLFAFEQNQQPGTPSMQVTEIVLEPIGPDSFLLRAETNLQSNFKQNLRDLDEAIKLTPDSGRAHWLRSRVLAAMGRVEEGVESSQRAVSLEPNNARYRVTHAQILDQAGRHDESVAAAAAAIKMSEKRPHVKARAQCLMGDLLADAPEPDWAAALQFHTAAIQTADPLAVDRHPAIRLAAKEVMIDAHLGAANDIAWGRWAGKEKAVAEWTRRAAAFAEELIANDGGTDEHRFRVASRSLAAIVGVEGKMDPTDWVRESVEIGRKMVAEAADEDEKRQWNWDLGMALFNAVQIYQTRGEFDFALECGREAARHFTPETPEAPLSPEQRYALGRLHFRLGSIHALDRKDHAAAVTCFDLAEPLLHEPVSKTPDAEWGRHGETLVSMGISYWETGQHEKAVALTKRGLDLIKSAVAAGMMRPDVLGVPYENLAAMQRHLGNVAEAEQMERLAADSRSPETAGHDNTAGKPAETTRR